MSVDGVSVPVGAVAGVDVVISGVGESVVAGVSVLVSGEVDGDAAVVVSEAVPVVVSDVAAVFVSDVAAVVPGDVVGVSGDVVGDSDVDVSGVAEELAAVLVIGVVDVVGGSATRGIRC